MTIQELLLQSNIPSQYGVMDTQTNPPFIVYMGETPDILAADNIPYFKTNNYRLEYYFKDKDEQLENQLEELLMSDGWFFNKSDDLYISTENIFVIYYHIERMQNYGN